MPTLIPPTESDRLLAAGRDAAESRFWAHFGLQPSGVTLIRESGEWKRVKTPTQTRLADADTIRDANGDVAPGYFLGGHVYQVSAAIAAEIAAADLGATIS